MRDVTRFVGWMCAAGAFAALSFQPAAAQEETPPVDPAVLAETAPLAESLSDRPAEISTADFASRSDVRGAALSPDGSKLVVRTASGDNDVLNVIDTRTQQVVDRTTVGTEDTTLSWFQWAGNDKLIMSIILTAEMYNVNFPYSRMLAWDLATDRAFPIGLDRMSLVGDDVIYVADDGSEILLSVESHFGSQPEVFRIPLEPDSKPEEIQSSKRDVSSWVADDTGVVRLGFGRAGKKLKVRYRPDGDSDFETIAKLSPDDEDARFWEVMRIVSGSDSGYVLREDDSGRVALREVNYANGEIGETVYQNPDWDLTGAMLDEDGEPLAVYYTDDRDRIVWLRDKEQRLQDRLEKALPGKEVRIVERADDDAMFLVSSTGADDPGAIYLYDPAAGRLVMVHKFRPSIDETQLVVPTEITYQARDGTPIRAVLTLPRGREARALPLIVMPHGGPYGVRDKVVYEDQAQMLANRGYAVLQPNYRGSGGYGEGFVEAGYGQIGRAMQDDLDDAMDWAVAEGIADPARVCVVGASYGGYAALFSVLRNPERYRCAASFAGVTDWDKQLSYDRRYLTRKASRRLKEHVVGDELAFDMDSVSVYRLADRLARPVLIAHGKEDGNVPFDQYERFMRATDGSEFVTSLVFEEEGHGFYEAENEQAWYDALLAFLAKHNPAD